MVMLAQLGQFIKNHVQLKRVKYMIYKIYFITFRGGSWGGEGWRGRRERGEGRTENMGIRKTAELAGVRLKPGKSNLS